MMLARWFESVAKAKPTDTQASALMFLPHGSRHQLSSVQFLHVQRQSFFSPQLSKGKQIIIIVFK